MEKTRGEIGSGGENIARAFLERQGFAFVTANWSCKAGEVDLIMASGSTLVFVEVRTRRPTSYGEGLETVAHEKQRKLIRTAQYYQQKEDYWGDIRFDVVSIIVAPDHEPEIEHIEYAFEVEG